MATKQRFEDPDAALAALAGALTVQRSNERCESPIGRVLAEPAVADRDSPAADVSAMDGYAVRLAEITADQPHVFSAISKPGCEPPRSQDPVIQIFTGAVVPPAFDTVIKREETRESAGQIEVPSETLQRLSIGENIRTAGENAVIGSEVLPAGTRLTAAGLAALANFGITEPLVAAKIRVAIITTGDEVLDPTVRSLEPWQLRNSNRVAVASMLSQYPFLDVTTQVHCPDLKASLRQAMDQALEENDAVVLTGGVSKGDHDYVPEIIGAVGGRIVFHGLPIRPGKPILGAATDSGKLILGLPGNPVSTTVNCHRFLLPLLRYQSGESQWQQKRGNLMLTSAPRKAIPLHAMLLVRITSDGMAELVVSQGSGDLASLSRSDGYVSVAPGEQHVGPWPYSPWNV